MGIPCCNKLLSFYFDESQMPDIVRTYIAQTMAGAREHAAPDMETYRRAKDAIILARDYAWNCACPAAYRDTDPEKILPGRMAAVSRAHDTKGFSFYIYGTPGTQKSRVAVCVMAMLFMRGLRVKMLDATTFAGEATNCMERGADGLTFIDRCGLYDLLVLDDCFKRKQTEMQEFCLYSVLERRMGQAEKHTLLTSNVPLSEMANYFTATGQENTADAIIRRIKESCRVLRFQPYVPEGNSNGKGK